MTISRRDLLKSGAAIGLTSALPSASGVLADEPQTLQVAIWAQWAKVYGDLANQFEAANPGVKVTIESAPQQTFYDRLLTRIASGDVPDVAMVVDFRFSEFQSRGLLRNLSDFIGKTSQFDASKPGLGTFYPTPVNFFTSHGGVYAIPLEVNPMGIEYNAEIFAKAGVPTPYDQWKAGTWTWDAFVDTAKEMTGGQGTARQYGYAENRVQIWNNACRVWANDGAFFNADQTECLLDQPAAYDAIQWIFDLDLKHHVVPTNMRSIQGNPENWFPQGRAAMGWVTTWSRFYNAKAKFTWGVAPLPRKVKEASWSGGTGFSIPTQSKKPDLAWKFIAFATTPDSAKFLLKNGSPGSACVAAMNSDAFVYEPPQHSELFLHMLETAQPQPFIVKEAQFQAIHDREMDLVATGSKSAEDATKTIVQEVNPLLKA
jgi:multiple sugar transport system substrate-binding protein